MAMGHRGRGCALLWALSAAFGLASCGYHYYAGPLSPAPVQAGQASIGDDGSVAHHLDGLVVQVRPMLDAELNEQFAGQSRDGAHSTNPYTFADLEFDPVFPGRQRFTVLRLKVMNVGRPKAQVDPAKIAITAADGREYWSLSLPQLDSYYRAYTSGYRGDAYSRYRARMDVLNRTTYKNEEVFIDQQKSGYVVFPILDHDVSEVVVHIHDVVLRFDYRNEPVERTDLEYRFERDTGKLYDDGRVILHARRRQER